MRRRNVWGSRSQRRLQRRRARVAATRRRVRDLVAAATVMSVLALVVPSASAAGALSITVSSAPKSVAPGQAIAYTINAVNTGGSTATSVTISDALNGVGAGQLTAPATTSNLGNCTFTSPTVTCNASSLAPGQTWTVTITGAVTAAAGTTLSDTATVTGPESATTVTASATTTTTVSQTLAAGFAQTKLAGGLNKPIALAFAPSGDIYICE